MNPQEQPQCRQHSETSISKRVKAEDSGACTQKAKATGSQVWGYIETLNLKRGGRRGRGRLKTEEGPMKNRGNR